MKGCHSHFWLKAITCQPVELESCSNPLTLYCLAAFEDFRKNAEMHVALRGNFSAPVRVTDLVEVSKDAASLLFYTRKIFFAWGCVFFVSDIIMEDF